MTHKETLPLLAKAKEEWKKSETIQDMCEEYGVDVNYIDLIPMAFLDDLDVSARTDKGIIYFNSKLIDDFLENQLHYGSHELRHHFQQCFGDGPTEPISDVNYLDNENEQEGFQSQTEYITETEGPEKAEKYVEKVLQHHEIPLKERDKRKEELLNIAFKIT